VVQIFGAMSWTTSLVTASAPGPEIDWSDWEDLAVPSEWTWAKIASLETIFYANASVGTTVVNRVEIKVTARSSAAEIDYLFSDGTNVYYNYVPERTIILLILVPVLPKILRRRRRRARISAD